jgi:hypothetical protein
MEETEKKEKEQPVSEIDRANLAAERLKSANKERARLLAIEEKLLIERKLSGTSEAGTEAKPVSEEELKKQKTKEFWKGSEIEKAIEKHG